MSTSVQKNITIPLPMLGDLELKASRSGLSISEYIRILIFNDTKDVRDQPWQLSKEQEDAVNESIQAYEQGEYIELDSADKIEAFAGGKLDE